MKTIQLKKIVVRENRSNTKVSFVYVDENKRRGTLWFKVSAPTKDLLVSANAFILVFLLIAMKKKVDIDCDAYPITTGFGKNINKIQKRVIRLFPELDLQETRIYAREKTSKAPRSQRNGSFFTGGVDSFFTLTNANDLNELLYVIGFDIRVTDKKLQKVVTPKIKNIASESQLGCKFISTNLREITEPVFYWEYVYGMALGSVANLFNCYKTIYISSGLSLAHELADGSHSTLDHLYSNPCVNIKNFGQRNTRIEKLKSIFKGNKNLAQQYLRVCWRNINNTYNCGVCEKCVRTKMELDTFGLLQGSVIFSNNDILPYLRSITIQSKVRLHYFSEIAKTFKKRTPEYLSELREKIKDFKSANSAYAIVDPFPGKKKNVLFIDFNGVISCNPFWVTIKNDNHVFNKYFTKIENFIFKDNKSMVIDWMVGTVTTEDVHQTLAKELSIPHNEILKIQELFIEECKRIDISEEILDKLEDLKKYYHVVLVTDNMDTFHRFTLPHNKRLTSVFDEIHDSCVRKKFKKSNGGELFVEVCNRYNVPIEYATLIDDSVNNCACFSSLGGRIYTPRSEEDVLAALADIETDIKNKWEWQY